MSRALPRTIRRIAARTLPLALALAALPVSHAHAQRGAPGDYRSWIDTTYAFSRGGVIDADQVAGDVIVTTWERPEVRVRAWAEHGQVRSRFSPDRVELRVEGERDGDRNRRIGDSGFEITVPRGTRVKLASVSGNVRVEGTGSEVEASAVSGDVTVRGVGGLASVHSVSGDVSVSRVDGDLTARSVSGDVQVSDVSGDVRAGTVSGEIELEGLRSRVVTVKSTSGDIDFAGVLAPDGRYELRSHSGNITVSVPSDAAANVSFSTFSGSFESDFPVTIGGSERRRSGRDMEFTLGGGGARLTVQTFSGDVMLERR
ncbi:MAG TPA: DUF4097 family beta strand repeat-containing protein [Gemmatimonadales bacterium]